MIQEQTLQILAYSVNNLTVQKRKLLSQGLEYWKFEKKVWEYSIDNIRKWNRKKYLQIEKKILIHCLGIYIQKSRKMEKKYFGIKYQTYLNIEEIS